MDERTMGRRVTLLRCAIQYRIQVAATYHDQRRLFCPHVLGHKESEWRVLAWQLPGRGEGPVTVGSQWRCFRVSELEEMSLRRGRWHRGFAAGRGYGSCVDDIDEEVDPAHAALAEHDHV